MKRFKVRRCRQWPHPSATSLSRAPRHLIALLGVLAALWCSPAAAQYAGKISGAVKDAQTGEALIGANVVVVGTTLGGSTDFEGSFFILNIPAGKYDLQATMLGYEKVVLRGIIVNSGKTTAAEFSLKPTTIETDVVTIQAVRPDVEKEKTSTSTIIRSDDVTAIAGMRDVNDVIGLAADVTDGHFRGGRSNEEYYTLQGLGIVNPLDNSAAFRPIMSAVEEVEVITSGMDAQYGNAQSGVVNITMKEGKSDKWRSKFELRLRAPTMKHFGPGLYDEHAQPYLRTFALTDTMFWFGDPNSTPNGDIPIIGWTTSRFASDTAVMVQMAQNIWRSVTGRDLNRTYWNTIDYSVEGAAGGPVVDGVTMFLALKSEIEHPIAPTEEPDAKRQLMGNLAFDLGNDAALRVSGGYQSEFDNILGSGTGFYQWMWDRILGIAYRKRTNIQTGLRFTQALSLSSFYEIKLNALQTRNRQGTSPWYDQITDAVRNMETGSGIITRTMNFMSYSALSGKTFFYLGNNLGSFTNEKTTTVSLDASYTSQVTKNHLLNGGIQANYYFLDVNNIGSIQSRGSITLRKYTGEPYELGLYVQDKMEFEGMIAKVGLRWDLWDSNTKYYLNQFDPFAVLDSLGRTSSTQDPDRAPQEDTKPIGRLQPRFGISFPVSERTVFHLNYGTFMQRPSFQYVIGSTQRMIPLPGDPTVSSLSNPRLKPQVTNSYDVGVMQGFEDGFTLDVSGYYKDIKDLLEQAVYTGLSGTSYFSYFNRDYADVRGFRVSLARRRGDITGSVNYQFGVATGKSASAGNAPVAILETRSGADSTDLKKVPVRDVLLNFDRTHNLIVNLAYSTGAEFGPMVLDAYPFSNIVLSASTFARSGRPYTSPSNQTNVNGMRTPAEYNTNLKITKTFKDVVGSSMTVYLEIFNLFDNKILNYNYLFNSANKVDGNLITPLYEQYAWDDPNNGVLYWDNENLGNYGVDHSFVLYDNVPRSFYFGVSVDF